MKKYRAFVFLLIFSLPCLSQTNFNYIIGGYDNDRANDMIAAPDGGYYMVGGTGSFGDGSYDVLLIKTDRNGKILWCKSFGTPFQEEGVKIKIDKKNNLVITAAAYFLNVTYGTLIIKTDLEGNIIWNRYLYLDNIGGMCIDDNNEILVSTKKSSSYCVAKVKENGEINWIKVYSGVPNYPGGIYPVSDKCFVTQVGTFGCCNILMKIDSSGNLIWNIAIENGPYPMDNTLFELKDGSYLYFTTFWGTIAIYKISKDGVLTIDSKAFGGAGVSLPTSVVQISDSVYVVGGSTKSIGNASGDAFLTKIDTSGKIFWTSYFGSGYAPRKLLANENGYLMCGITSYDCNFSPSDFYVTQTDLRGINNCFGYFGGFSVYDSVATFLTNSINVTNIPNPDTTISLVVNSFDLFQVELCAKREIKRTTTYPNPCGDYFYLRMEFDDQDRLCPSYIVPEEYSFEIFDILGRRVIFTNINNEPLSFVNRWESKISTVALANGIYCWRLSSQNNSLVESGKLLIIKPK